MDDANRLIAELFASLFKDSGGTSVDGATVSIAGHTLSLVTQVEEIFARADGQTVAGVIVKCAVDGKAVDALRSGSVGIDASEMAALRTAAQEWVGQVGLTLYQALAAAEPTRVAGGFKIYASPIGIRGRKPSGLAQFEPSFLAVLEPELATLFPERTGLHAITIAASNQDGTIDGDWRIDARPSTQLRRVALQASWPASDQRYMLKQYFVLVGD